MTIAQIVYDNELHFGYSHEEIYEKVPCFSLLSSFLPYLSSLLVFPRGRGYCGDSSAIVQAKLCALLRAPPYSINYPF